MTTRLPDWPQRLNRYIVEAEARYAQTGLVWGEFDCATFVCDWASIATGADPMADYRRLYHSREEAAKALRALGDGTLEGALQRVFGEPVPAASGQRGDIAFRREDKTCGIFIAQGARMRAVFLGESGLMGLPALHFDLAFRVG